MANDDLAGTLIGYRDKVVAGAKAVAGAASKVGNVLGVGTPPPAAPMPGRLPLDKVPTKMPEVPTISKVNTNTGDFSKKKF
jgi:hypothetical protein